MKFTNVSVLAFIAASIEVSAFGPTAKSHVAPFGTELHAVPPMIIGPMIRKMREEKAKKKMPMANEDELRGQAPGLRVGGAAWKWPPVWPYDQNFFTPPEDLPKPDPSAQLNGMAGLLSGGVAAPTPADVEVAEADKLDVIKYWTDENANVRTELDNEAVEKLKG
jgi:hypothetical protein